MMVDTNCKISFWNSASEKLFGYTKQEALGRNVIEVLAGSNAKDDCECMSKWLNAIETQTQEYLAQRKDGSFVPLLINRSSVVPLSQHRQDRGVK